MGKTNQCRTVVASLFLGECSLANYFLIYQSILRKLSLIRIPLTTEKWVNNFSYVHFKLEDYSSNLPKVL